jgi:DNA-binding transcriptional regulator YiaG
MNRKKLVYEGLGFPIILVGFKIRKVRGEELPNVNFKELQAQVFEALTVKPGRLTGSELLFVRSYLELTQAQFARKVGLANHSRVSQWEKKASKASGMEYLTELSVRLLMASAIRDGLIAKVYKELSEHRIKSEAAPVEVQSGSAA